MRKLSYPQEHVFEKPFDEQNVKSWKALRIQLGALSRAYPEYTRTELIQHLTKKWSSKNRERFVRWLRFYDGAEQEKYSASDRLIAKVANFTLYLGQHRLGAEARDLRNATLELCKPYRETIKAQTLQRLIRWAAEDFNSEQNANLIQQIERIVEQNAFGDQTEYSWADIKQLCDEANAPQIKTLLRQQYFSDPTTGELVAEDNSEVWDEDDFIGDLEDLRDALATGDVLSSPVSSPSSASTEDMEIEIAKEAIAEYTVRDLKKLGPEEEWPDILEDIFFGLVGEHRRGELSITGQDLLSLVKTTGSMPSFNIDERAHWIEFCLSVVHPELDQQTIREQARLLDKESFKD